MKYLYILGIALAVFATNRWLYYHRRLLVIRRYHKALTDFWQKGPESVRDRAGEHLQLKRLRVRAILDQLGLMDEGVAVSRFVGYGQVTSGINRPFDNPTDNIQDVVVMHFQTLKQAIGELTEQRNESLSPFFWLELVWFAPKHVAPGLEKLPVLFKNLIQLIYWGVILGAALKAGTFDDLIAAMKTIIAVK